MSLFNLPVEEGVKKSKPKSVHPWSRTIKDEFSPHIKLSHNSVKNVRYPKPKEKVPSSKRATFTVVGNRVTKEFIYCVNLVQGMHKYRWKKFGPPVIKGVTGVEWESITLRDLQIKYGSVAHCLQSQVAVIRNDELIGGEKELKELIEAKYYINLLALDYKKESIKQFASYLKEIGRPCAYLHITVNEKPIGSLMFMLYSDIVPRTCENFLRLCQLKKGGYCGTPVHRIVKDGWIQCGGFGLKSIEMDCENFIVPFDRRGVLGMANAGRHSDCSTQFFVLLQPNKCFKLRFVAFGQLIDGQETLKKIEAIETYYEAPLENITIVSAGIVNLDCKDIAINKGAREYIEQHIDDLVIIGEMFYAMLLEKVYLEVEFRRLQRLEAAMGEGEHVGGEDEFGNYVDELGNYVPENIRATRRFIRKKGELQNQGDEKNQQDTLERKRRSTITRPSKVLNKTEALAENNDFDVEAYEPEEYSYSQISGPSSLPKPTKPYYLALTDVPYPGEVDSTFDLKRFLQGDYCLEADLKSKGISMDKVHKKWRRDMKMQAVSTIISSYGGVKWCINSSDSSSSSPNELDSDEEEEIRNYLQQHGEKASFSGQVVKKIANNYTSNNPVDEKKSYELWNDEEVRRMRLAVQDIKNRENKKVSISVEPWETHKQIQRRETGYVKREDIPDDDDDDDDEVLPKGDIRKASVSICAPDRITRQIKRRQTGYVHPEDMNKMKVLPMEESDEDDEDDEEKKASKGGTRKSGVRIAPKEMNTHQFVSPVHSRQSVVPDKADDKARPSVLMRLYDDIAMDDRGPTPTLKDYKPMADMPKKTFTLAEDLVDHFIMRRDKNVFQQQLTQRESSSIGELPSTSQKRRRSTADSIKPHTHKHSMRTIEYSRKRPSISVAEYQMRNKMEMEAALAKKMQIEAQEKSTRTGLRLPGDSPIYNSK